MKIPGATTIMVKQEHIGYGACSFKGLTVLPELKNAPELLKAHLAYRSGCYHCESEVGVPYCRNKF